MKIASWNVNSLNVRLPHLLQWLDTFRPDVVGLQETKLEDAKFPVDALREAGFEIAFSGQKTYNGVALLARRGELEDVQRGIPGFDDEQRRVIAATVDGIRIVNLYVVNGQDIGHRQVRLQAALAGGRARLAGRGPAALAEDGGDGGFQHRAG